MLRLVNFRLRGWTPECDEDSCMFESAWVAIMIHHCVFMHTCLNNMHNTLTWPQDDDSHEGRSSVRARVKRTKPHPRVAVFKIDCVPLHAHAVTQAEGVRPCGSEARSNATFQWIYPSKAIVMIIHYLSNKGARRRARRVGTSRLGGGGGVSPQTRTIFAIFA